MRIGIIGRIGNISGELVALGDLVEMVDLVELGELVGLVDLVEYLELVALDNW